VKWRVALVAAALLAPASAAPAIAQNFQIPPVPDHYVTDNAGALSNDTRASLESRLRAYESSTGHQIIGWIGQTTGDVPLETWTAQTADHWKIGRHKYDDGAVLFIFMHDHKVRIEVGYGLESTLTDADSYRIIQRVILPGMRAGDVDGAVTGGVAAILTTITPNYANVTPPPESSRGGGAFDWTGLYIFLGFWAFIIVLHLIRNWLFGYLVLNSGSPAARAQMRRSRYFGGAFLGGFGGGGFGGGGFSGGGGGFSAGGGGFGGGGASGGW
jgi:uncharacterized protein